MENHQLNLQVAKRLGWDCVYWESMDTWDCFNDELDACAELPSWTDEIKHAMDLIIHKPFVIRHDMDHECHMTYVVTIEHEGTEASIRNDSLPLAIVKCWLTLGNMVEYD